MDNVTAKDIWDRSPLDRAAAERIIASAGLPLAIADGDFSPLCTTLASLALLAFEHALQPQWPRGLGAAILRDYTSLLSNLSHVISFPGAPPMPPVEWLTAMNDWVGNIVTATEEPKGGRPAKSIDYVMYPKLLGFYALAYGKRPAHTVDGPTERFLAAFLETLKKVADTVRLDGPEEVLARIALPSKTFAVPTSAALRGRIRTFYKEPNTALVQEMVNQFREDHPPQGHRLS